MEAANIFRTRIHMEISKIDEELLKVKTKSTVTSQNTQQNKTTVRAKLPKLTVNKFDGDPKKWPEFWDSYKNSIYENESLSEMDKFSYLKGLLEEVAKDEITGFTLTEVNFKSAVELLKTRSGRQDIICQAHVEASWKMSPVFSDCDVPKLRKMHAELEMHARALEAMGTPSHTYATFLLPVMMEKLPETIHLSLVEVREKLSTEWTMEAKLRSFLKQIE